jgi:DNA polymerase-3 subunit epsilon
MVVFATDDDVEDSDDPVTEQASTAIDMPIAYAVSQRLNPGCPISPGATAIHGISDQDVADCPRFDDPEIVGLFRAFEDMGGIFCGHNVASFDLPIAHASGYIKEPDFIDTIRIARKITADDPFPHPNAVLPEGSLAHLGLDAFSSSLTGLHVALTGERFDGAHGAMADVIANVRVFRGLMDGWLPEEDVISFQVNSADPVGAFLNYVNTPPKGQVGWCGWLKEVDTATSFGHEFNRGKHKGTMLHEVERTDKRYIDWLLGPKGPDDLSDEARQVLQGPDNIPF